jgi:hypothetical protein
MRKMIPLNIAEKCPECGCPFNCRMVGMEGGCEAVTMFYCSFCRLPYLDMDTHYVAIFDSEVKAKILAGMRIAAKRFALRGDN